MAFNLNYLPFPFLAFSHLQGWVQNLHFLFSAPHHLRWLRESRPCLFRNLPVFLPSQWWRLFHFQVCHCRVVSLCPWITINASVSLTLHFTRRYYAICVKLAFGGIKASLHIHFRECLLSHKLFTNSHISISLTSWLDNEILRIIVRNFEYSF